MSLIIILLALASPGVAAAKATSSDDLAAVSGVTSSTSEATKTASALAPTAASETTTSGAFWKILEHGERALALGVALLALLATLAELTVKARYGWGVTTNFSIFRVWRRLRNPIASLNDYVTLLAAFRSKLENYCKRHKDEIPTIFIFTRQLPSDWPLWDTIPNLNFEDNTPLERYTRDFGRFLARWKNSGVQLRRVIVLDNFESPTGRHRYRRLIDDIKDGAFSKYVQRLHTGEDDVWVWEYNCPWPAWLTDSVFFGVTKKTDAKPGLPNWFWAVTSSYDSQEDLIVLQWHHRLRRRAAGPLPADCRSLNDLAEGLATSSVAEGLATMAHAGLCTLKAFREKADLAIPSSDRTAHPPKGDTDNWARWEWQLGNAVQNADQLKAALAELGPAYVAEVSAITTPIPWKLFPVKITPHMLQSLKRGLAHNLPGAWEAFRASFIPSAEEAARIGDASNGRDGIGEEHRDVNPVKAITKFYENRVLFRVTAMCPAHCRYCFRRRMVTDVRGTWDEQAIEEGIQHIASDGTIKEVILSGGDPLVLGDSHIHTLLCRLREIGHVHRVRIDTRALTTLPQRFTDSLIGILQQDRQSKPVYVVGHFSHAYELEPMAHEACRRLVDAGIPVLAHIPLLRGVNDSSDQLSTLMEKLVDWRVRPYYLIQYIPTPWTEQFRVPLRRGCEIVRELHQQCSGLAIPTFIVHLPGGAGKVPVIPKYVKSKGRKGWIFRTPKGPVLYPEPSS